MKKQNGAALVVVLSLLSVSLMVGLSSMQSSQIDERLAGNYQMRAELHMAAENAVSQGWEFLNNENGGLIAYFLENSGDFSAQVALGWAEISNIAHVNYSCGDFECAYAFFHDADSEDNYILGSSSLSADGGLVGQSSIVAARVEFGTIPNPLFGRGLLSADAIRVTGQSTVNGDVHGNGEVSISIRNDRYSTDEDGNIIENWTLTNGSDFMVDVPLPGDRPSSESDESSCTGSLPVLHCYKDYQGDVFSQYSPGSREGAISSCDVSLSSLSDGDTVFCNGNLVVGGGSVEGKSITLVSTGNVTMNGATSTRPPEEVDIGLYVISGGDIELNGNSDNYGVFWASGFVRQNGNSSLYGSVVAGTYIRSNGGIDFTAIDNITNPDTFIEAELALREWR